MNSGACSTMRAPDAAQGLPTPSPLRGNPFSVVANGRRVSRECGSADPQCSRTSDNIPAQAALDPREVARIAAAYPPEAAGVSVWDRERHFTPLQLTAWEQRFGADDGRIEMSGQTQRIFDHG